MMNKTFVVSLFMEVSTEKGMIEVIAMQHGDYYDRDSTGCCESTNEWYPIQTWYGWMREGPEEAVTFKP